MHGNSKLRITGGKVYDPANGVNGEIRPVCVCDGKIVADVEGGRTIDATGMIICDGTYCNNSPTANVGGLSASNSELNFRIVNSTGSSRSVYWSLLRIN